MEDRKDHKKEEAPCSDFCYKDGEDQTSSFHETMDEKDIPIWKLLVNFGLLFIHVMREDNEQWPDTYLIEKEDFLMCIKDLGLEESSSFYELEKKLNDVFFYDQSRETILDRFEEFAYERVGYGDGDFGNWRPPKRRGSTDLTIDEEVEKLFEKHGGCRPLMVVRYEGVRIL